MRKDTNKTRKDMRRSWHALRRHRKTNAWLKWSRCTRRAIVRGRSTSQNSRWLKSIRWNWAKITFLSSKIWVSQYKDTTVWSMHLEVVRKIWLPCWKIWNTAQQTHTERPKICIGMLIGCGAVWKNTQDSRTDTCSTTSIFCPKKLGTNICTNLKTRPKTILLSSSKTWVKHYSINQLNSSMNFRGATIWTCTKNSGKWSPLTTHCCPTICFYALLSSLNFYQSATSKCGPGWQTLERNATNVLTFWKVTKTWRGIKKWPTVSSYHMYCCNGIRVSIFVPSDVWRLSSPS